MFATALACSVTPGRNLQSATFSAETSPSKTGLVPASNRDPVFVRGVLHLLRPESVELTTRFLLLFAARRLRPLKGNISTNARAVVMSHWEVCFGPPVSLGAGLQSQNHIPSSPSGSPPQKHQAGTFVQASRNVGKTLMAPPAHPSVPGFLLTKPQIGGRF